MYDTLPGTVMLRFIMKTRADRIMVRFLRSAASKPVISRYARKHAIGVTPEELQSYGSFRDFFVRESGAPAVDSCPGHLISPCDGWLSVHEIDDGSVFNIKGSRYGISNLIRDSVIAEKYKGGICLIIRLCASDYHYYCYIDDAWQGTNHFIDGELHSVQPAALGKYPVFALNRRSWCVLETDHFGPVIQTEVGALVVGGIVNDRENERVKRGEEKGHFELAGSTIVLMFEPGWVKMLPAFAKGTADSETRVTQGMWIGVSLTDES